MYAQKLSFNYAHTLHTVRIVHNAHSVHRSRVEKGQSCVCINFVRATDPAMGSAGFLIEAQNYLRENHADMFLNEKSREHFNYYPDRLWKVIPQPETNPIFLWQLLWDREIR